VTIALSGIGRNGLPARSTGRGRLVHADTRFWDASAVQLAMGGSGPHLRFQSIPALFEGAVAFLTPEHAPTEQVAKPDTMFTLYDSRDLAEHTPGERAVDYRVVFHAEEAGALDVGAPVTLDEKRTGTVTQSPVLQPPGLWSLVISNSPASIQLSLQEANKLRAKLPPEVQATLLKHDSDGTTDADRIRCGCQGFL
jgi:paraquat-inducible protein B